MTSSLTPRGAAKRESIARAAAGVFAIRGYEASRMEDIAEAAGVTKPTLYLYFSNKEDVLKEAARLGPGACLATLKAIEEDRDMSPWAKVEAMVNALYQGMIEDGAGGLVPVISETAARFPDLSRYFRDEFIREINETAKRIIVAGVKSGAFKTTPLTTSITLIVGPPLTIALGVAMFNQLSDEPFYDLKAEKKSHIKALKKLLH